MFFKNKKYSESDILNIGLVFAMEFGENWLSPIQKRLSKKIPDLTNESLDKYNTICKSTLDKGIEKLFNILDDIDPKSPLKNKDLFKLFESEIKRDFNWISNKNMERLYSQCRYYAWKDGVAHGKVL